MCVLWCTCSVACRSACLLPFCLSEMHVCVLGDLPKIVAFQQGPDKKTSFRVLKDEDSTKEIAMGMVKTGHEAIHTVNDMEDFQAWGNILQPRLLLCTEKTEAPSVMAALAIEFEGYVAMALSPMGSDVCRQFLGEIKKQQMILIIGQIGEEVPGGNPGERQVSAAHMHTHRHTCFFFAPLCDSCCVFAAVV